ncbi:GNAT family N-acetyltransferase [Mycolicibacterium mengxianglii]|uniref:GNAT family N-acetyltransferase n=1 Tax=Mycolicibacterium mengxianglii TaxID=2736649 RepID=UPI0018D12B42|nr:GNAT family N-acetyltransferase [Mycolicibacterium mengxianglii]
MAPRREQSVPKATTVGRVDIRAPRRATPADVPAITSLVAAAFGKYIERIGKPPAPMLADYAALLDDARVWVLAEDDALIGVLVTMARDDHLYLDTVAVAPAAAGAGYGRILLDHAERDARELGFDEVRLCTNEAMTENLSYYPRRGYHETARRVEDGYRRVFFSKGPLRPA